MEPDKMKMEILIFDTVKEMTEIIFLVTGKNKAQIINEIIEKKNTHLPASLVKPKGGELFYLMDRYAASEISYR